MRAVKLGASIPGLYPSTFTAHDVEMDKQERASRHRRPWVPKPVENRVEYVHPDGRYATVRFLFERGTFCESFRLRRDSHG